jgi:cell division protein FtsQ
VLKQKAIIIKILVVTAWLLVIVGIGSLLVAANRKHRDHLCSELLISMRGGKGIYIEKDDILKLIQKTVSGNLLNKPVSDINLARLERSLETNAWIKDAELYIDSKDALHVSVEERQPIARVFTTAGRSFYIDSSGHAMPLLEKMSARVPVITGFPGGSRWNAKDSSLMKEVKEIAWFIYNDEFWNAQTGQIEITAERKFELIPVIGEHIVKLGNGGQISDKLKRLYIFYKQVLAKTGPNKYAVLDVQYNNQVVAVKKEPASPVDSIQLQHNIEELMMRATMSYGDEGMLSQNLTAAPKDTARLAAAISNQVSTKTNPVPIESKKPKAVMGRMGE